MSTRTRTRTTRICTVAADPPQAPAPGEVWCLVERTELAPAHGTHPSTHRSNVLTQDPRSNLGRRPRWEGWLGTTNDVHERALGAYRVVSVTPWEPGRADEPRWRVSLAPTERDED